MRGSAVEPIRGPAWIILASWLLFLTGCEGPERNQPIRLLDLLSEDVIEWHPLPPARGAPGLETSVLPVRSSSARVGRVLMYGDQSAGTPKLRPQGHESRVALLAPPGSRYRFRLEAPPDGELRLGLGYVPSSQEPAPVLRFQIEVESDNSSTVLLDEAVSVRPDGSWRDLRLSLGRWAGKEIALALTTEAPAGQPQVWGAWSSPEVVQANRREPGWDVVLISLDTLRADHLGCYGYHRPTSPYLDAFARRSVRFAMAVSQSPWTQPSHRSLLSGLFPISRQGLSSPRLPVVLWRAGYRTRALTSGGQLHYRFGFHRGFEEYRIIDWLRSQSEVVARGLSEPGRKQFLFLHTYEIHDPFTHTGFAKGLERGRLGEQFSNRHYHRLGKKLTAEEKVYVEALYDGGIAFTDRKLGLLFEEFQASGVMERAIVIVTSDHGEQFWEHGAFRHGEVMYDHQLLVPLLVYLPPGLRRELGLPPEPESLVIQQQVRLVDLYPTILDLLGIPLSHRIQGRSLRPLLEGKTLAPVDAFAEHTNRRTERKALRSARYKFVETWETDRRELYDLRKDPGEQVNLVDKLPGVAESMAARLAAIARGGEPDEREVGLPSDITPELREQLEALGYLGN